MTRVSLKSIKKELEKFKTLDEKRQYLETIIGKTKTEKLKKSLQKLLDEVLKHLKHETKLTGETPLEEKLASREFPAETPPITSAGFQSAIKYVPRKGESALEKETGFIPPFKSTPLTGIKYEPKAMAYAGFRESIEDIRFYLSQQAKLVRAFTPDTWTGLGAEGQKEAFNTVANMIGSKEYERVMTYIRPAFNIGKPEEKYKSKPH